MKILNPSIFNYGFTLSYINRLLTSQQAENLIHKIQSYRRKENYVKNIILHILIIIWLQLSSLLIILFNNYLLDFYINIKSVPIVNTMQDVIDNEQYSIISTPTWFKNVILPRIPINEQDKFSKRLNKHNLFIPEIMPGVIKGKAIILTNTYTAEFFMAMWNQWQERLAVSQNKYGPNLMSFHVKKKFPFSKKLLFL